jgi:ABC-type multidrug transport system fused ATPase/permease subunit
MKLNQEQTTYIENYIARFDIKYYEIYMEILDHLILGVEAILEEDKTISFEDAVVKAKVEGFGRTSFNELMEEKVKLAHKKNTKNNNKMIRQYFTVPKIALTLFVFVVYYLFLLPFENPVKANLIAIASVGFIGIFQSIYSWKYRKHSKRYILKTQVLNSTFFLSFLGVNITQLFTNFGRESIDFNHILMRLFMTLIFTFSFISVLVYIEVRKKTIVELKQQIFA